ncbi:hypothetical protein CcCBS67573_g07114 [Chytriomyces confervae]|uniref:Uncharacterized protein n=1 Tax=Chytriomyces confervae TaxID=246404 RepID=A0A507EZ29_9FUNG|nr:hypothetical protein CcCBS67573_g07114 [Chytriomyces confervae]
MNYQNKPTSPMGPRASRTSLPRPILTNPGEMFSDSPLDEELPYISPLPRPATRQSIRPSLYEQPEAVKVLHSKAALPSVGIAAVAALISAVLSVVAAAMYNWFVVNYSTGSYTANYGLFNGQTCGPSPFATAVNNPFGQQNTFGQQATQCVTAGFVCSGSSFCSTLQAFQAFTILGCVCVFLALAAAGVLLIAIHNGHYASSVARTTKLSAIILAASTFFCQLLSVILFAVFQSQANAAVSFSGVPSFSIGSPFTSVNQFRAVSQGSSNIPYGSFGSYGSSFVCMILAFLFSLAAVAALLYAARCIQRIDAPAIADYGHRPSMSNLHRANSLSPSMRGQPIIIDGIEYVPTLKRPQPIVIDGQEFVPSTSHRYSYGGN